MDDKRITDIEQIVSQLVKNFADLQARSRRRFLLGIAAGLTLGGTGYFVAPQIQLGDYAFFLALAMGAMTIRFFCGEKRHDEDMSRRLDIRIKWRDKAAAMFATSSELQILLDYLQLRVIQFDNAFLDPMLRG